MRSREQNRLTVREYTRLVYRDFWRLGYGFSWGKFVRALVLGDEAFQYLFWLRTCRFLRGQGALCSLLFVVAYVMYRHYGYKFGISIPYRTRIAGGCFISHGFGLVVNHDSIIGRNVNLAQGVTLGKANRGLNKGAPIVGDNVYFGPGSKIVGRVHIGDSAAVGANCVVTKDVPGGGVVVGVPGKVISLEGSQGYVNHTDYGADAPWKVTGG